MKKQKLAIKVLKRTGAVKFLYAFIAFFFIMTLCIWLVEPRMITYADALWYCFNVMTTIGFGDIIATTLLGKILSVILSLYSILIIGIIPGIITSYYIETIKLKANESTEKFLDDLKRLPELSQEELRDISERAKKFESQRKNK